MLTNNPNKLHFLQSSQQSTPQEKTLGKTKRMALAVFSCAMVSIGFALTQAANAQGTTATLNGTVQDATGAVIPSATVTLKDENSTSVRTSKSNGSGFFSFAGVPSGDYDVTIAAKGFRGFEQKALHLDPGDQRTVRDLKLTPGETTDTVTVTTATDSINLDSGEQSSLISAEQIKHLSVEGRDVTELFKILPGFAIAGGEDNRAYDPSQVSVNGALGSYAANGSPLNGVSLLSDGADITDPGNFGAAIQNVNYEQVAEVKVQTSSFTADGARGPVVVNAVGKSGGSSYHGSLYTYARTSQLNSTDWIANYTGQAKPPDRQVYPGFTFGGPVLIPGTDFNRNRHLTFFVGAEDYAQRNVYAYGSAGSAQLTALVPTAGMRTGDFSQTQLQQYLGPNFTNGSYYAINNVPVTDPNGNPLINGNISSFVDPGASSILNGMPLPNVASNANGYNWITTNLVQNDLWQTRGRVDDSINDNEKLFGSYSIERGAAGVPQSPYYSPRGAMGGVNVAGGGLLSTIDSQIASINLVSILKPTLTNELYVAGAYFKQNYVAKNLAATEGFPYQGLYKTGSTVQPALSDYGNDGLPLSLTPDLSFGGQFSVKQVLSAGDNLTKVVKTHTFRTGVFYQHDINHQSSPNYNGTNGIITQYYLANVQYGTPTTVYNTGSGWGGNYLADFLEGHFFSYAQSNKIVAPNLYFFNLAGYVQDHWRVNRHLSIDAGVRIEHFTPWQDSHGLGVPVFDPSSYSNPLSAILPGFKWHAIDKSVPLGGFSAKWAFVSPRLGFSWDTRGTGNTIVRGGFGMYRTHDSYNEATAGVSTVEGQRVSSIYFSDFNLLASQGAAATVNDSAFQPDNTVSGLKLGDNEQPQVITWNLSVDQRMPWHTLLEIAYVGNHSDDLLNDGSNQPITLDNINALPVGALYQPNPTTGITYPLLPPNSSCSNCSVGSLDQAHIDSFRKYPLYNGLNIAQHNAWANYDALQVGWTKQQGRFLFSTNYTWSKALAVWGGLVSSTPTDPFNYHNDYNPASFDHRHIFNASYSYQLGDVVKGHRFIALATNGWEVSGITNYQSGANLPSIIAPNFGLGGTINTPNASLGISNTNLLGTPDVSLQPTLTCSPSSKKAAHQYMDGSCFGLNPTVGQNGAYRLPYLPGPGYFNTDLTMSKSFHIREQQSIQFKVAAFNALNRANHSFTSVQPGATSLGYGQIAANSVSAGLAAATSQNANFGLAPLREGRRIMELALRYDF